MAFVQFLVKERKNSSVNVTLGSHNIQEQERTQQVIPVRRAIPHPDYKNFSNDILLLKKGQADCSCEVLQPAQGQGPGEVQTGVQCGWLGESLNGPCSNHSSEGELTRQQDHECESRFQRYYSRASQICVGDPQKKKTSFKKALAWVELRRTVRVRLEPWDKGGDKSCPGPDLPRSLLSETTHPQEVERAGPRGGQLSPSSLCPQGGSGGPPFCNNVVQGTFSCGQSNGTPPGVFTKVSHFLPWVKRTMKCL
ncbi:hypothetical protein HPG69_002224 [Diceros bicornis minor]|uniref:Peptidase S1 domain-containing protein n=1 Tax=Diceros bicornis minor TaxID=77932 RepID=A0A7J7FDH5_DICBM|nr:hypothetical protein HPG69_002224 [Diceros bicornis minor]